MTLTSDDGSAIRLTLELASIVTLLIIGTPLPIVLPPTVPGFYFPVAMGPQQGQRPTKKTDAALSFLSIFYPHFPPRFS